MKRLLDILYAPLYIAAEIVEIIKEKDKTTPTWLKLLAPVLAVGGLGLFAVLSFLQAFVMTAWFGNPLLVLGFDQSPEQPMHFPHTIHAGVGLLIDENTGEPYVSPTDMIAYKAASQAMKTTYGKEPVPVRSGGSIPIVALFEKELNVKSILFGFGLDSDAIHSPNEHYGIFNYLKGKPMSPKNSNWDKALEYWSKLKSDGDAVFDKEISLEGKDIKPMVTWGTSPQDVVDIDGIVPDPENEQNEDRKNSINRSLKYMGLKPKTKIKDIRIDKVFIGSCTNGRIEDLREAAKILKDKKIASHVNAMIVPGSGLVKQQAEQEGLDVIFKNSGFEWREPGCSMCLAMNADKLKPEERCASTSNRNFEGRQGRGGRTHLVSPAMAAAAAISGNLDDVRKYNS